MQTTDPKKLIAQTTNNLERLCKDLVKELYIAGSILDLLAQEQKDYHEAKSQIAARAKTLEDLTRQIAAGHAELERQVAERAEVNKAVWRRRSTTSDVPLGRLGNIDRAADGGGRSGITQPPRRPIVS